MSQIMKSMKEKQERTIVHLEYDGEHYYFGSFSAIYTRFTSLELGVALGTLRNYGVKADKPYHNNKCIIRKGILITMPKR